MRIWQPIVLGLPLALALSVYSANASSGERLGSLQGGEQEHDEHWQHSRGQEKEEHHGPLHDTMEGIQHALRALGHSLRAKDGEADSMRSVGAIENGFIAALAIAPETPEEMTAASERTRFRIAFQRKIIQALDTALQLEDALLGHDQTAAVKLFGDLRTHKKEGHEHFQLEDEEDDDDGDSR